MRHAFSIGLTLLAILGAGLLFLIGFLLIEGPSPAEPQTYGVTFSRPYAEEELHLDADAVLAASLDELGIRRYRLPAYWKHLEPEQGTWDFAYLDQDINAIEARGGSIILAVGLKLPRWPECWEPSWWKDLDADARNQATLEYVRTIVERYKDRPSIVAWQVENEPHFEYGDCPKTDLGFHKQETDLVRSIDTSRPIVTTDSGELSLWLTFGRTVDRLGVSVYRVVRNPIIGTWRYWFIPPSFYRRKAELLKAFGLRGIYVSEFQMEPWNNKPLPETTIDDQLATFDITQMRKNFEFASRMGIESIDFWGVEWWYWMKETQDHPEFWEEARRAYTRSP